MLRGLKKAACAAFALVAAASAAGAQPVKLKASVYTPPAHYLTQFWIDLVKELNESARGSAEIELYHSEALGKSTEQWDIVREGLADISFTVSAIFYPARFPLSMFVELPFFNQKPETSNLVLQELVKRKLITSEFEEVRLLTAYNTPPAQIFSKKPLQKLEDFRGLRIVGQGPVWSRTWLLLGAQGVAVGWPDIYLALDRGTVDAAPGNWAASKGWKWAEVAGYPVEIGIMGGFFNAAVVNHASWAKIPEETKVAWTKIMEGVPPRIAKLAEANEDAGRAFAQEKGREIFVFPAAERQRMAEKLLPIWQDWMSRNEKAGKPAREIYKTFREVMERAGEPVVMQLVQ